jgi:hemerythrin superfamily protein
MNIYNYLKRDHRTVAELFDKILSTKSLEKRKSMFQEVANELLIHAETENATFYAALKEHEETEEIIEHAEKEHAEVKKYIAKIRGLSIESEKWLEQFGEFKHSVTHHVEEEEGDIFEKARKVLETEQENQLAIDMDALKKELKAA